MLRVSELDFMGITVQGLKPDPSKVEAILGLEAPRNKDEVQRMNGAVNYLAKFLHKLSQVMEPIKCLRKNDDIRHWEESQEREFQEMKLLVAQAPVLAYYKQTRN